MLSNRTDICSPDYVRTWMGLPDTKGKFDGGNVVARVQSIEIMWHISGPTEPGVLLRVMFPTPTGYMLLRKSRIEEVADSLENGNQERKLQQLMTEFHFLLDEVKTLQSLNRNVIGRAISKPVFMRTLKTASYGLSLFIFVFLLFSLVREDTVQTSGNFMETGVAYKFDILFLQKYGRTYLPYELWKLYDNAVFANELQYVYRQFFSLVKALQLALILAQFVVYLVVHGKADYTREGRDLLKCLSYRDFLYYCPYIACAALAFSELFISLTIIVFIFEYTSRTDAARAVIGAISGTRGNRSGLTLLGSTFVLLLLICLIFAMILFQTSPHDIAEENLVCTSFIGCALVLINTGLRNGGGIGESLKVYEYEFHPMSWAGFNTALNFIFFLSVNAIMLNVVFGIIIDSFAARRDEQKDRLNHNLNECTICGLWKANFKDPKRPFAYHVKKEVKSVGVG